MFFLVFDTEHAVFNRAHKTAHRINPQQISNGAAHGRTVQRRKVSNYLLNSQSFCEKFLHFFVIGVYWVSELPESEILRYLCRKDSTPWR